MEKEQKLLVLQEADSVRQQELSSLRQDLQEAQGGQKELSAQVLPMLVMGPVPWWKAAPDIERAAAQDPLIKRAILFFRITGGAGTLATLAGEAGQNWAGWGLGDLTQS